VHVRDRLAFIGYRVGCRDLRDRLDGWDSLAPRLAPCEERESLDMASQLEPVSGFEPLTVRLQGQSR
jgi:hypothetical protein